MSNLTNDKLFEAVKLSAHQLNVDIYQLNDAEFLEKYTVSKVEVTINTKVLDALQQVGNMEALIPVYSWFEWVLIGALNR